MHVECLSDVEYTSKLVIVLQRPNLNDWSLMGFLRYREFEMSRVKLHIVID